MKSFFIRIKQSHVLVIVWMTACFFIIAQGAYSQNVVDFTGKWILSKSQSKSLLPEVATSTILIFQDKNSVTMDITITITPNNGKPISRTEKYVFNASIATKKNKLEEESTRIDCIPAPDGKSFSITETLSYVKNGTKRESKRVSVYSLGKGGKTLIIKQYDTLPEGSLTPEDERHEIRVYDKSI